MITILLVFDMKPSDELCKFPKYETSSSIVDVHLASNTRRFCFSFARNQMSHIRTNIIISFIRIGLYVKELQTLLTGLKQGKSQRKYIPYLFSHDNLIEIRSFHRHILQVKFFQNQRSFSISNKSA